MSKFITENEYYRLLREYDATIKEITDKAWNSIIADGLAEKATKEEVEDEIKNRINKLITDYEDNILRKKLTDEKDSDGQEQNQ